VNELTGAEEAALVGGLRGDALLAALVDGAVDFTSLQARNHENKPLVDNEKMISIICLGEYLLAEAGDAVEGSPLAQPRVPDIPRRISFGREGARLTRTGTLSEKCH